MDLWCKNHHGSVCCRQVVTRSVEKYSHFASLVRFDAGVLDLATHQRIRLPADPFLRAKVDTVSENRCSGRKFRPR